MIAQLDSVERLESLIKSPRYQKKYAMIVNDNVVTGSYNDHLSMLEGIEKLDGNPIPHLTRAWGGLAGE